MTCCCIQRRQPHTRPLHPRRQSGWFPNRCSWRTRLSSVPRPRPGGSERLRLASCQRAPRTKPDFWNAQTKRHSTETCRISLIQNLEKQSRNPRFHSASTYSMTYSWLGSMWHSIRDEQWNYSTCKLSKLLTVRGFRKHWHHDMPQHSAILRSPPHTRPLPPHRQSGSFSNRCSWRTRLSSVPRPRPGGSDRSRLASCQRALRTKPDFWNAQTKRHSTETCRISLIQNLEKQSRNPRFHSASTYSMTYSWVGSIWQLNSIRDERYETTAPANHPNFSL